MTRYEEAKWFCEKEMIDAAHHIKVMEEEIDKVHKVSMYLIGKYKKDLIEEFKVKVTSKEDFFKTGIFNMVPTDSSDAMYEAHVIMEVFDKIGEEMKKKYPEPWYSYGITNVSKEENK
ncbi:MAG: hypothetical protein IKP60_13875 [Treponema sp.]|nr:hypothetical protein [Treponema sp.]